MTRTCDVFVPLDERADIASGPKADLLISIHADALDVKRFGVKSLQEVRGGTIYTLSEEASDEQAKLWRRRRTRPMSRRVLQTSNRRRPFSEDINSIFNDLESRSKKNRSLAIAN